MPQQNENITQNDENQDVDQILFNEEEFDPAELIGVCRSIYNKYGNVVGFEWLF